MGKTPPLRTNWVALSKSHLAPLRALVEALDGHGVFDPSMAEDLGLPPATLLPYVEVHRSNPRGSGKEQLFSPQGHHLASLRGCHGLIVLRAIVFAFHLPGSNALGRGTEARELQSQILSHLKEPPCPNPNPNPPSGSTTSTPNA